MKNDSAIRSTIWSAPSVILGKITMTSLASDNDDGVSGCDLLVSPHGELYRCGWSAGAELSFHRSLELITPSEALRIHEEIITSSWRKWPRHAPRNGCYIDVAAVQAFDECARRLLSGEEVEFPFPPDKDTWVVDCPDLRASPDLAQAALERNIAHITMEDVDCRRRIVLRCGLPDTVRVFMDHWAPSQGLVIIYGDPARGFAGGYLLPHNVEVRAETGTD